jgi:protein associated with RNAse G/E
VRTPVVSHKRKFDGSTKKAAWHGDLVDETDDGWLVVFYERPAHHVRGEPVVYALQYFSPERPLVVLVNFDAHGRVLEYQCDAAFPAEVSDGRIDYVDLDLDMMIDADGAVVDRDFDQFEERRVSMSYSEEAVRLAHEGLALAHELLERGAAPFDGSPRRILERVAGIRGP